MDAKKMAFEVCQKLFKNYDFIPDKIAPTKEEGVFLSYDSFNAYTNRSLVVEVYNNLEIAVIVTNNDSKQIDYSEDL
jgi:hypothetical protein